MISLVENTQLERIEEAEGDFYAQLLFLVFWRVGHMTIPARVNPHALADTINEATADMNERVARRTGK